MTDEPENDFTFQGQKNIELLALSLYLVMKFTIEYSFTY